MFLAGLIIREVRDIVEVETNGSCWQDSDVDGTECVKDCACAEAFEWLKVREARCEIRSNEHPAANHHRHPS